VTYCANRSRSWRRPSTTTSTSAASSTGRASTTTNGSTGTACRSAASRASESRVRVPSCCSRTPLDRPADPADRLVRAWRHVVPRDVHDPPAQVLEACDPATVALPREPAVVPFEPVTLERHTDGEPDEVESVAIDPMLGGVGPQSVRAEQAGRP